MKKLIFFVTIILFYSNIQAQSDKWRLGIEGGVNLGYLKSEYQISTDRELTKFPSGVNAGLAVQYKISHLFFIQSGLYYKGMNAYDYSESFVGTIKTFYSATYKYDYIVLPLLLKFSLGNDFRLNVTGGGQLGYLFKQEDEFKSSDKDLNRTYENIDLYHRLDIGINIGLGISYLVNDQIGISLDFRSNRGVVGITKKTSGIYIFRGPTYSYSANALLGIWYNIGKK